MTCTKKQLCHNNFLPPTLSPCQAKEGNSPDALLCLYTALAWHALETERDRKARTEGVNGFYARRRRVEVRDPQGHGEAVGVAGLLRTSSSRSRFERRGVL
jgi:hypothetical protein